MSGLSLMQKWTLAQSMLEDTGLSPSAKNIGVRLLHHSNSGTGRCDPSYATLARGTGLQRRRAIEGVKELEKAGWIRVNRRSVGDVKGKKGGLPSNDFEFAQVRKTSAKSDTTPSDENSTSYGAGLDTRASADNGTRVVRNPTPPSAENDTSPSVESGTQNRESIKPGKKPGNETPRARTRAKRRDEEFGNQFQEFWRQYPKQVGEERARKAYRTALSKTSADQILQGVLRYAHARTGEDPQYTKEPANWLKDQRWLDEPKPQGSRQLTWSEMAQGSVEIGAPRERLSPNERAMAEMIGGKGGSR